MINRIFISLIVLSGLLCIPNAGEYVVPNFLGGINVDYDSTDLAPNEAVLMSNFVLDMPNVLMSRQGFSYWNIYPVDTTKDIDAIYFYEPYSDTIRMVFVSDGYVYICPTISDPDTVGWDTLRLGFSDDSLIVTYDSDTVRACTTTYTAWWYTKVCKGDILLVDDDTSGTEYTISSISYQNDYKLTVTPNYKGATDTSSYKVYHKITGSEDILENKDRLYISDSDRYTVVYNDTNYQFLALVDSGIVSDTISIGDSLRIYSDGMAHIDYHSNIVHGNGDVVWDDVNVDSGMKFIYIGQRGGGGSGGKIPRRWEDFRWNSIVLSADSGSRTIVLSDSFSYSNVKDYWNNYEVSYSNVPCNFNAQYEIFDSTKNWDDYEYGDEYLTGFNIATCGYIGWGSDYKIYCNSDNSFQMATYSWPDWRYYIYSFYPFDKGSGGPDVNYPSFEQIVFYFGQMYGFGKAYFREVLGLNYFGGYNRIWYSDLMMPFYMRYNYNFDLNDNDDITCLFEILGKLYIGTKTSIWISSGLPRTKTYVGDQSIDRIVYGLGIPDKDCWVKASNEYGYFINHQGIYYFNGIRASRISDRIDAFLDKYQGSQKVLGYFDEKLFVSFPDSNITLIYDENARAFYTWPFGMTCFYAPADTNIFFFGHSQHKGFIFYYPNNLYTDMFPAGSAAFTCDYKSGWQSFRDYSLNKKINKIDWSINSLGPAVVRVYKDFVDNVAADTAVIDSVGNYVYGWLFDGDCVGEYFQIGLSISAGSKIALRRYAVEWQEEVPLTK